MSVMTINSLLRIAFSNPFMGGVWSCKLERNAGIILVAENTFRFACGRESIINAQRVYLSDPS